MAEWRILFARLLMLGGIACGIVGLVVGVADREWKLASTGWFTGGTLIAVLAIVLLADHYFESQKKGRGQPDRPES